MLQEINKVILTFVIDLEGVKRLMIFLKPTKSNIISLHI